LAALGIAQATLRQAQDIGLALPSFAQNLCLASYSLNLFFESKELIEGPYTLSEIRNVGDNPEFFSRKYIFFHG